MHENPSPRRWTDLLLSRWHGPAALVAIGLLVQTVFTLRPAAPKVDVQASLSDISLLEARGQLDAAAAGMETILSAPSADLSDEVRAGLHRRAAAALHRLERHAAPHDPQRLQRILQHDHAAGLDAATEGESLLRQIEILDWLGRGAEAESFVGRLARAPLSAPDEGRLVDVLTGLVDRGELSRDAARDAVSSMLDRGDATPATVWWALRRAFEATLRASGPDAAAELLRSKGGVLGVDSYRGYLQVLEAELEMQRLNVGQARAALQWIEEWLPQRPPDAAALDARGDLRLMTRRLRGDVEMALGESQAAFDAYDYVRLATADAALARQAVVGQSAALDELGRSDEASRLLEAFIATLPATDHDSRAAMAAAAMERYRRATEGGLVDDALASLALAISAQGDEDAAALVALHEERGAAAADAARRSADPGRAKALFAIAGDSFAAGAARAMAASPERVELLWMAGDALEQAGRLPESIVAFTSFLDECSDDGRTPGTLLRLGAMQEMTGDPAGALGAYTRVMAEFSELADAARAALASAQLQYMLGDGDETEAATLLERLLSDGEVGPSSGVFRDALTLLCELHAARGEHTQAISRLEELRTRYPDHEPLLTGLMLGDAYRQSGEALLDGAPPTSTDSGDDTAEGRRRLRQAVATYDDVLDALRRAAHDAGADEIERLATLHRADCLFELGDDASLDEARRVYEQAAARFDRDASALAARTQVAAIDLRRGAVSDARDGMAQARRVLRDLPDEAFTSTGAQSRSEWERFFEAALASPLLGDAEQ